MRRRRLESLVQRAVMLGPHARQEAIGESLRLAEREQYEKVSRSPTGKNICLSRETKGAIASLSRKERIVAKSICLSRE
eukprot:4247573-Pleurochrysis_carterae.AAC.1